MKRINPDTGKPYKTGDTREKDNLIFKQYRLSKINKNGYFYEVWIVHKIITKPKKLNPKTSKEWVYGELNEQGMYFTDYKNYADKNGHPFMGFLGCDAFIRKTISQRKINIIRKCKEKNISFNLNCLNTDYLISIFPDDMKCPVLGVDMKWGLVEENYLYESPSLDKINPSKGYIRGNVAWISLRANRIKSNATFDEVMKVAKWLEKISR